MRQASGQFLSLMLTSYSDDGNEEEVLLSIHYVTPWLTMFSSNFP